MISCSPTSLNYMNSRSLPNDKTNIVLNFPVMLRWPFFIVNLNLDYMKVRLRIKDLILFVGHL